MLLAALIYIVLRGILRFKWTPGTIFRWTLCFYIFCLDEDYVKVETSWYFICDSHAQIKTFSFMSPSFSLLVLVLVLIK